MPLTRTAKMLMLWQSVLSLATLGPDLRPRDQHPELVRQTHRGEHERRPGDAHAPHDGVMRIPQWMTMLSSAGRSSFFALMRNRTARKATVSNPAPTTNATW